MSAQQLLASPSLYSQVLPVYVPLVLQASTSNQTFTWASLGVGFGTAPSAIIAVNNDATWAYYGVNVVSFSATNVVLKQVSSSGVPEVFSVKLIVFP